MKAEDEDSTAMVLRGATYEEAMSMVGDIDVDGLSVLEVAELINPILSKYGWSFLKIMEETIRRNGVQ